MQLVLLFDKHCPDCSSGALKVRRQLGTATLTLLERQGDQFFARERWQANYGANDGHKGCLADRRTPEGLYYTKEIHKGVSGPKYGYTSILLDYPNVDDRLGVLELRGQCADPGAFIAIHGGHPGVTLGCIRLLDTTPPPERIHYRSIAYLASLIRAVPGARVPVVSVDYASAGCHPALGAALSAGCAEALRRITAGERPTRGVVKRCPQALAANFSPQEQATLNGTPLPTPARVVTESETAKPLPVRGIWATSEASRCGPEQDKQCAARHLLDGLSDTVWCAGGDGTGVGDWLAVQLPAPAPVSRLVIRNGNWQRGQTSADWYFHGRVETLEISAGGQSTICKSSTLENSTLVCTLPGLRTQIVTLQIKKATPGSLFIDTCLSDLMLYAN